MKFFVFTFAAVLLYAVEAKVVPEEHQVHTVTAHIPLTADLHDGEEPIQAQVVEIKPQHLSPTTVAAEIAEANHVTKVPSVAKPIIHSEVVGDIVTQTEDVAVTPTAEPAQAVDAVPTVESFQATAAAGDVTQKAVDTYACDRECTKLDYTPVCATNGFCLHEFANQCVMDTFTCLHPSLGFKATKDDRCQMDWLKRCSEKDLID